MSMGTENTPAGTIRTAEYLKHTDGKISRIVLFFDATAWRAMMRIREKPNLDVAEHSHVTSRAR
jgi:hypothetical protein